VKVGEERGGKETDGYPLTLGIPYLRVHEVKVKLPVWKKSNYLEV
jgi:hypothetical protein